MPTLNHDDVEIHYQDTGGDGRPVVLIHGWPLSGESWSGTVPALSEVGLRVITYDRRGFGQSTPSASGAYDYDTLSSDLAALLDSLDLREVSLVGFSMGGGEVARFVGRHGTELLHSLVFAAAIPPYLLKDDQLNPDGGLTGEAAEHMQASLRDDRTTFFDEFVTNFFSANGELKVGHTELEKAKSLAAQADLDAAVACIGSWLEDFTADLIKVDVPTLVIHGDADAIVPLEASGQRTHDQVSGSELVVIKDGTHGLIDSDAEKFNQALLTFLTR